MYLKHLSKLGDEDVEKLRAELNDNLKNHMKNMFNYR